MENFFEILLCGGHVTSLHSYKFFIKISDREMFHDDTSLIDLLLDMFRAMNLKTNLRVKFLRRFISCT